MTKKDPTLACRTRELVPVKCEPLKPLPLDERACILGKIMLEFNTQIKIIVAMLH